MVQTLIVNLQVQASLATNTDKLNKFILVGNEVIGNSATELVKIDATTLATLKTTYIDGLGFDLLDENSFYFSGTLIGLKDLLTTKTPFNIYIARTEQAIDVETLAKACFTNGFEISKVIYETECLIANATEYKRLMENNVNLSIYHSKKTFSMLNVAFNFANSLGLGVYNLGLYNSEKHELLIDDANYSLIEAGVVAWYQDSAENLSLNYKNDIAIKEINAIVVECSKQSYAGFSKIKTSNAGLFYNNATNLIAFNDIIKTINNSLITFNQNRALFKATQLVSYVDIDGVTKEPYYMVNYEKFDNWASLTTAQQEAVLNEYKATKTIDTILSITINSIILRLVINGIVTN